MSIFFHAEKIYFCAEKMYFYAEKKYFHALEEKLPGLEEKLPGLEIKLPGVEENILSILCRASLSCGVFSPKPTVTDRRVKQKVSHQQGYRPKLNYRNITKETTARYYSYLTSKFSFRLQHRRTKMVQPIPEAAHN